MILQPAQDPAPFLTLEDVTLRLYDRLLFEQTNWRFLADQHWAVIGGNGAGKTTLMKALCGQAPVVAGRIVYHLRGARPQDRIAYVSLQELQRVLGGEGAFYQARWNRGVGDGKLFVSGYLSASSVRRINPYQVVDPSPDGDLNGFAAHRQRVIELLDIQDLLRKEMIQLSDGERRKVAIAKALMQRPQLLILDNPLTGLDRRFKARLLEIMNGLMQGRLGDDVRILVATTRQDEIPEGVTHVLLVDNCRVIAQGPRERILNSPAARAIMDRASWPSSRHTRQRDALRIPPAQPLLAKQPGPQVLVDMRGVNVSYGAAQILRDVDWTVRSGEHWALLGPNGAGKSTLLSLILGDHPQVYANDVRLFGRRRGSGESIWEIKQRIGWVAPELHLYYPADGTRLRNATGLQVVESGFYDSVGLYRACSLEQRETARQWMEQLGIEERADAPFAKLSEGEQRLVLLARALVKRPLLLILDEPCQGLDAHNRERVRQIVDAIGSHTDTSVLYVTHNADELPQIIRHVLRLDKGQVVRDPSPS